MIVKSTRLAILLVCTLAHASAWAHTSLRESVPKADAVLAESPDQLELRFSEPVRLTAWSIRDAQDGDTALSARESGSAAHFTADAPELPVGRYTIHWRVVSADTHVVSGQIGFEIATPGTASIDTEPGEEDTHP